MTAHHLCIQLVAASLAVAGAAVPANADFYPTDDAMIVMKAPDNNYGSSSAMCTRNRYGAGNSAYWEWDALIRFDLSSLEPGSQIESATLHMYYYKWKDNNPAGRSLTCYRLTSDWDESTVTWNTQPSRMPDPTSEAFVPSSAGKWMTWDVTDDVRAFLNDPEIDHYGWEIMDEEPWNWFNIPVTYFYTKEYSDDYGTFTPYLTVVPEPASMMLLASGALVLRGRRRWR